MRRLDAGSVSDHRADDGTAKCPESLCPVPVLPLLGNRVPTPERTLLPRLRSYGLMRQSHLTLPSFSYELRSRSLSRSLPAPAVSGIFPTLSLRILPRMPGPLPRRVPQSAHTCFFLRVIGLPQQGCGSAYPLLPANTIFRGAYFRGCRHFFMFKPPSFAHLPDRSYPCAYCRRAAEAFTSEQNMLRYLRMHRICLPSEYRQLTARGLSPR